MQSVKGFLAALAVAGMMFGLGCAHKEPYKPPAPWLEDRGPVSSGQYTSVVLADMDNDGSLDIVAGATQRGTVTPETLSIWYGDGKGGWSAPVSLPVKGDVRSVAVADFNEDGLKDIVFSIQRESHGIRVWFSGRERRWVRGTTPIDVNKYEGVRTAGVNGDRHWDIVAANATSEEEGGIQIWLGDGKGNWKRESGPLNTGRFMDVALGDFNGDGYVDIVGASWGRAYGALKVWLGNGRGDWADTPTLDVGNFHHLDVGDVDGDGNEDILVGTYLMGVQVFINDGTGRFSRGPAPTNGGSYWKPLLTDLDGDGRMDLIASSISGDGIRAWKNLGQGGWEPLFGLFPSTGVYYDLTVGDVDGQGLDDLCAASYGEGVKVWLGKGGSAVPGGRIARREEVVPAMEAVSVEPEKNAVFKTQDGVPEYRIGPGDLLEITLWQVTTGSKEEVRVKPNGTISFGLVEDLCVQGLTATELDTLLTGKMRRFMREPRLDVFVKEFRSKSCTFLGAIERLANRDSGPGVYPLKGKAFLVDMLSVAGGPSRDANLRTVSVRRKTGEQVVVDLYKATIQGDQSQNIVLDDQDVVFIPSISEMSNRVYVFGEVKSPGVFPYTQHIDILEAISKAGGFTDSARLDSAKVIRGDITRPSVLSTDIDGLLKKGDQSQNIALLNGDVVYVPRTFIGDVNSFLAKLTPLLNFLLYPAQFRDAYMYSDVLRFDIGEGRQTPTTTTVRITGQ